MTAVSDPARSFKVLWVFFLVAVLAFAAPLAGGLKIRRALQTRLELVMSGKFVPAPFAPSFRLKDAAFEWRGKVRLDSGDLLVHYDPAALLRNTLKLRLSGTGLEIRLLDDWAKSQGVE